MGVGRWRDSSVGYLEIVDLETHEQDAAAEVVAAVAVTGELRSLSFGIRELSVPVFAAV